MITISLCMIVKNEEDVLARCLNSVGGLADEIIVIDTGSTDATKEIALKYTNLVYDFTWIDDFSAARNYSFSKGTMQYLMWLDADDVLLESDKNMLLALKETLPEDTDVVMMRYNTALDESGKPLFSFYRERLLRREAGFKWKGAVHEAIETFGKKYYSEAAVTHAKLKQSEPGRNLRIYEKLISQGAVLTGRDLFYYSRELYYDGRDEDAEKAFIEYLEQKGGFIENKIEACRFLAFCRYRLKKDSEALQALLKSLKYDRPRAELCCDIGKHYLDRNSPENALPWFELALNIKRNDASGAFVLPDCYDYIPLIQLCVCYDRLGNIAAAEECNRMAGLLKPFSPAYQHNKRYFENKKSKQQ